MADKAVSQRVSNARCLDSVLVVTQADFYSNQFVCLACGSKKLLWKGIKTDRGEPSLEGSPQFPIHKGLGQQGQEVKGQVSLTCLRLQGSVVSGREESRWTVGLRLLRGLSRIVGTLDEKQVGVWRWGGWIWPLKGSMLKPPHGVLAS